MELFTHVFLAIAEICEQVETESGKDYKSEDKSSSILEPLFRDLGSVNRKDNKRYSHLIPKS